MRGDLDSGIKKNIWLKIPNLNSDFMLVTGIFGGSDILISDASSGRNKGTALVCLSDAGQRFRVHVRFALFEMLACLNWYRSKEKENEAAITGQFYADYVALILYAIAEDLALFVKNWLVEEKDWQTWVSQPKTSQLLKDKSVSGDAAKVGLFLKHNKPKHDFTKASQDMIQDQDYKKAIKYRNRWVHDKPPVLKDTGFQFTRTGHIQDIGNGLTKVSPHIAQPDFNIDELTTIVLNASLKVADTLNWFSDYVREEREASGVTFDDDKVTYKFQT